MKETTRYESTGDLARESSDVLILVGLVAAAVFAFNAFVPIFSPLLAGMLGLWLVLGRPGVWVRIGIVAAGVFVLGLGSARFILFLLLIVLSTAAMTYGMSQLMAVVSRTAYRGTQFSLWEVAGMMLAMGLVCGAIRLIFQQESMLFFDEVQFVTLTAQAFAMSANMVLGSLCIFVPEQHRSRRLFQLSAAAVLVVMPGLEIIVAVANGWGWSMVVLIPLMHLGGASTLWLMLFPLELAGLFREANIRESYPAMAEPAEEDPLA
ncbi:hypothetical protein [Blastopirellula marina]|uniref:Uncharacterized protein n=1 Tax=Blastopirellula marina TaxID=124 RepID=A0A2S8GQ81_9BACT|nr:hypothetical protein [Blastopirellula marina]PQO46174.1 hypothetical protein C5Y93_09290 [Blastopirellula marina]